MKYLLPAAMSFLFIASCSGPDYSLISCGHYTEVMGDDPDTFRKSTQILSLIVAERSKVDDE